MKVAFLVVRSIQNVGGIEKYTYELGRRLVAKGHEVIVYSMGHYGSEAGEVEGMSIRIVPTIKTRSFEKMSAAFSASVLAATVRDIDIVHVHAFGPGTFSGIPRLLGKKVVVQGHGIEWQRSRWGLLGRAFLKLTEIPSVRFPDALTVVSNTQRKYLARTYGVESQVIPTGVNPPEIRKAYRIVNEYGLTEGSYILFASRLVKEKNPDLLLNAFSRVNTDKKLVLAGDVRHEPQYKAQLESLAARDDRVLMTGFVTGDLLHELFSNAFLFVLPSDLEGLPTVLLEAMSYGRCCLASDIDENLEAIGDYGVSFRSGDIEDLTRALQELVDNPERTEAIGKESKDYALQNFSWDDIADQFDSFYKQVIG